MKRLPVRAYTDKISYEAGEALSVHVDSDHQNASIRLIRMLDSVEGDHNRDRDIAWDAAGHYDLPAQSHCVTSFVTGPTRVGADHNPGGGVGAITVGATVWSAKYAQDDDQVIVSLGGTASSALSLEVHNSRIALSARDLAGGLEWTVTTEEPLVDHCWYVIVGSYDGSTAQVWALPQDRLYGDGRHIAGPAGTTPSTIDLTTFTAGARFPRQIEQSGRVWRGIADAGFNGKIENPFVIEGIADSADLEDLASRGTSPIDVFGDRVLAGWDFAMHVGDDPMRARPTAAGQPEGVVVNLPTRAVTGSRFSGRILNYQHAPDEYAAVHFHSTDLVDVGWNPAVTAPLPADLPSGVYGIVVTTTTGSDTVPIVLVPRKADERNRIAVVLPTFSYLAYANESLFNGLDSSAMTPAEVVVDDVDQAHVDDPTFGLSMYDTHPDGSGVAYSSARRAIVNFRRGYRMWLNDGGRGFSAEMYLVEWLDRLGFDVDIITDAEVHERGEEYLSPYAVLLSGSHPEYTSEAMLDALERYRDGGGSLLYLGGNGWYWVTGVVDTAPLVVEIRRGMAGIRCWESYPGEVTLLSTGEPGGLWRHRGRAPQKLTGVGMAAQGWGGSEPYYRSDRAADPDMSWIFEGVEDDPIGAYGLSMDGAAGDEIDRADVALGTPPDAVVVASSRDHSNYYQRALEEIAMNLPEHGGGQQDPDVRADIVYFATPGGGEVFSVGSIAWSGALLHNGTDNGVSRMTANVIRRFVERRA